MSLSFEELRVTVKEQLDLLNETDLQAVTFKSIKEELLSKFSPDEIGKWKGEIKDFLGEYVNTRLNSAHSEGNDNSDVDEESEDEKSSQSSSSDSDDPTVAALPAEWREAFGEVCWVKGQKSFPW